MPPRPVKPCPPDRIACLVPFCRRTFKRRADEIDNPEAEAICGRHWVLTDKHQRQRLAKVARRWRRTLDEKERRHLNWLWWRIWERLKAQAIERAAGL